MKVVAILALLIYTCGAFGLGALLILWLRDPGGLRKPTACPVGQSLRETLRVGGAFLTISFVWFVSNGLSVLIRIVSGTGVWSLDALQLWLTFLFPPVVMHLYYVDATGALGRSPGRLWRAALLPAYAATQAMAIWSIVRLTRVLPGSIPFDTRVVNLSILVAFLIAVGYAVALMVRSAPARESTRERQSRRGDTTLFVVMAALFLLILTVPVTLARRSPPVAILFGVADIIAKSMPLLFMFVGTYFDNRFKFFDLFVKRGLSLLLTIGALTATFGLLLPLLGPAPGWAAPWIYAVALLPLVTAGPWLYGRIAATLDRRWLGRRFTPVEAVKHFLSGLRSATSEPQLIERAEQGLSEIFGASACVRLGATDVPPFRVAQEIPIGAGDAAMGRFLMGPRTSEAPYFGEDITLLASLGDVFASILDNLRLQERKLEQDQLARDLTLHASRSELKALRAQINPHFFFNALNAIAGLIHKDPAVADRTIEQLADVFRYALRGAESEWALLDDEIEFVRAYLDVERARFGARLSVDVRIAPDVRGARVPTMIVQTLVENAVKHGVAEIRGAAVVRIEARREGDRLLISVADNGPGFAEPPSRAAARPKAGGYGLANIRRRLEGYFGDAASLTIERDPRQGLTIAAVSMPFELHARPAALDAAVREAVS
jgi:anti-sigma regulatory factor (Ser/Thr protein kinase)